MVPYCIQKVGVRVARSVFSGLLLTIFPRHGDFFVDITYVGDGLATISYIGDGKCLYHYIV